MTNGNIKTTHQRVPIKFLEILEETRKRIEENGYEDGVFNLEILRLLIYYPPAREYFNLALDEICAGFSGVKKLNPEVKRWMKN